ncbi:hypothetical protein Q5691_27010 [Microcoleus sp. w1-18aA5]|uniref:hypothetical protein n=1 Tax=Microcoleus sp. w1-18aA5 TaxID=2818982 RepID=UPI002FD40334
MTQKPPPNDGRSQFFMGDNALKLDSLKRTAEQLGLAPYASLYGDKRCKSTWIKLLGSSDLHPLTPRYTEKSQPINIKFAIALFMGAMVLLFLLKPLHNKVFPIQVTIQFGAK